VATTLSEDWVGSATKPSLGPGNYIHGHVDGPTASDDFVVVYLEHDFRGIPKAVANSTIVVLHGSTAFTAQLIYGGDNEGAVDGDSVDIRVQVFHAGFILVSDTVFSAVGFFNAAGALANLLGPATGVSAELAAIKAELDLVAAAVGTPQRNSP
jgi:hypothetical protein